MWYASFLESPNVNGEEKLNLVMLNVVHSLQVQNCINSINVTWLLITVWHFIFVVDKDMKSCLK